MPAIECSLAATESFCKAPRTSNACRPKSILLQKKIVDHVNRLISDIYSCREGTTFHKFEKILIPRVFELGRLLVSLFFAVWQTHCEDTGLDRCDDPRYRRRQAQPRLLGTFFGEVKYWRTYVHGSSGGFYPLDRILQLPGDKFSLAVVGHMAFLATKVSYAQVTLLLKRFLGWSPSQTSIEKAVLGLGRRTARWFEAAPVAVECVARRVLVIMVDGKASPTVTDEELQRRRTKRAAKTKSSRHARRENRCRYNRKRRKPGDKSKNGRVATVLVMYSLEKSTDKTGRKMLEGPLDKWVYASYAPKRHAFAIARRQADRRGFTAGSGGRIQIVTDGDEDLARYANEYFPDATHTLDVIHAVEYLWRAGRALFPRCAEYVDGWVTELRDLLLDGGATKVVARLNEARARIPKTGPGNKAKRKTMMDIVNYLDKRIDMMRYREWADEDLEIGSGPVEGAVRHIVGQRFDCAGMRWIRERAEALLQLRCIAANGQWDQFLDHVQAELAPTTERVLQPDILSKAPDPLPTFGLPA
jgi:hypothetical protein